jgi:hypothetical protein
VSKGIVVKFEKKYSMKTLSRLLFIALIATVMTSCERDDDDDPNVPGTGRISGQLKLTDEFGIDRPFHDNVKVTTQTGKFGVSNGAGIYSIEGLKSGTYELTYEKSGHGTFKKFNIMVNSGSNGTILNGIDYLGAKSTTVITNLTASVNPTDTTLSFGCDVTPLPDATHPRAFRLFFAKTSGVSFQNYLYTPANTWVSTTGSGAITGFDPALLMQNGFLPGDSAYVIAYGESIRTNVYTVPGESKKVYPNINTAAPSNSAGFVMP